MVLGVLSDTHDNVWKLDVALPHLRRAQAVVHCGDLCAPFMVRRLAEGLGERPIHIIWGNNDGDTFLIGKVAAGYPMVNLHGPFAELDLAGRRVAVNHYPEIARGLARSGMYDVVCYGHDHTAHESREGDCLLLNPGEVMGLNGRSSLALVDLADLRVEFVDL